VWHRRLQRNKITDVIQNVICWPYRRAAGDRAGRGDPPPRLAAEPLRASRQTDVLTRFLNCRTGNRPLAYDCRLSPGAYQLQQELLLFFGFGLGGPKQGLFGILPELIGDSDIAHPPDNDTPRS
jgi:hypothetical protein